MAWDCKLIQLKERLQDGDRPLEVIGGLGRAYALERHLAISIGKDASRYWLGWGAVVTLI